MVRNTSKPAVGPGTGPQILSVCLSCIQYFHSYPCARSSRSFQVQRYPFCHSSVSRDSPQFYCRYLQQVGCLLSSWPCYTLVWSVISEVARFARSHLRLRCSQEAIDTDDGSSYYQTHDNFFVYADHGLKVPVPNAVISVALAACCEGASYVVNDSQSRLLDHLLCFSLTLGGSGIITCRMCMVMWGRALAKETI